MRKILLLTIVISACATFAAAAGDAKENFDKACAKCHGKEGKGDTKMGQKLSIRDLTDAKVQESFTDEGAFKAIKEGLKDKDGKTQMKAAEGLSDDDIKALVKQVRSLKR